MLTSPIAAPTAQEQFDIMWVNEMKDARGWIANEARRLGRTEISQELEQAFIAITRQTFAEVFPQRPLIMLEPPKSAAQLLFERFRQERREAKEKLGGEWRSGRWWERVPGKKTKTEMNRSWAAAEKMAWKRDRTAQKEEQKKKRKRERAADKTKRNVVAEDKRKERAEEKADEEDWDDDEDEEEGGVMLEEDFGHQGPEPVYAGDDNADDEDMEDA